MEGKLPLVLPLKSGKRWSKKRLKLQIVGHQQITKKKGALRSAGKVRTGGGESTTVARERVIAWKH